MAHHDHDTPTIPDPICYFCLKRFQHHSSLNLIRVVAVFASLQILPVAESFQPDSAWGPFLLFLTVIGTARWILVRFQTRPRYVWLIVSIFGHVAGFAYKSFFFYQMNALGLTTNAGMVLLAIPFLLLQSGVIQYLITFRKYVSEMFRQWLSKKGCCLRCTKEKAPLTRLSGARLQMASTDIRNDAFAAATGYLFFAAGAALFKSTTKEMHHLFLLEEPPCLKSEHDSSGSGGHHGSNSSSSHHRFLLSESSSSSSGSSHNSSGSSHNSSGSINDEQVDSTGTDIINLFVWIICFFILPIGEYYLYKLARRQKRQAQLIKEHAQEKQENQRCRRCLATLWYSNSSYTLGTLGTAIPFCMAFQGHHLIVNSIFEKMAHKAKDEESETYFLVVLILCALGGFVLSTFFPTITDMKQEALARKSRTEQSDSGSSSGSGSVTIVKNSSFSFIYRTKMLTPSHKEMWAVWVGLLFEIAAACANSKSTNVDVSKVIWAVVLVLVFLISGYFFAGPFSEIFEHHLHEQMAEETKGLDMLNPLQEDLNIEDGGVAGGVLPSFDKRETIERVGGGGSVGGSGEEKSQVVSSTN